MKKRPNILWLMSDQHNANCTGYSGHPNVKTPNLDKIAAGGVNFTRGYSNNPICSPSRLCFMSGQYMHHHGLFGNYHAELDHDNPNSLACLFRRQGYQTGLFGKSHMIRKWDDNGFERIRYTDLTDALSSQPRTVHYFDYLVENGLGDYYEEGSPRPGMQYTLDGSAPAQLPYEHSIERFTGNETLKFLEERDESRPFFIHMSFQRPHAPIAPAREYFDMYNPADMVLPESAVDYFENRFAGKPSFIADRVKNGGGYPLADPDENRLKRCLASYYALITCIDMEIGRVLDHLEAAGELENTIVFYTADHGDFAGEHGLFHKNLGLYDSIQHIPFLLSWPGGPRGVCCDALVESVDFYPTLCELCGLEMPDDLDGISLVPVATGEAPSKDAVFCEWESFEKTPRRISSIRTDQYRLVFYANSSEGELYDQHADPGEIHNLWDDPSRAAVKADLISRLLSFTLGYAGTTGVLRDRKMTAKERHNPTILIHKGRRIWSSLQHEFSRPIPLEEK